MTGTRECTIQQLSTTTQTTAVYNTAVCTGVYGIVLCVIVPFPTRR